VRLFLDFKAHSQKKGAFLLGDAANDASQAASRLFGYALGRRCGIFEYEQCNFSDRAVGSGKSWAARSVGAELSLESNYCRGHHSPEVLTPRHWRLLGGACLRALLDLDLLERPAMSPKLREDVIVGLPQAAAWFRATCCREKSNPSPQPPRPRGPSRALPHFAIVRGSSPDFIPSPWLERQPELVGKYVELVEQRDGVPGSDRPESLFRLHECDGGTWLARRDLVFKDCQRGRFMYRVLTRTLLSSNSRPSSGDLGLLMVGAVVTADERRVVDGRLRLSILPDLRAGRPKGGWASEHHSVAFDPRLGGTAQLLRLRDPAQG